MCSKSAGLIELALFFIFVQRYYNACDVQFMNLTVTTTGHTMHTVVRDRLSNVPVLVIADYPDCPNVSCCMCIFTVLRVQFMMTPSKVKLTSCKIRYHATRFGENALISAAVDVWPGLCSSHFSWGFPCLSPSCYAYVACVSA